MMYCSVNGRQVDNISIIDRGFSYGDGVFTTAKIVNGKVDMLTRHIQRLKDSCGILNISIPDINKLQQQIITLAKTYSLAVIKIIITAGEGGRGYSRVGCSVANIIISIYEFPKHYLNWQQKGVSLGTSRLKFGLNPLLSGLKHLNRLEQVLLRQEVDKVDEDDLLVTNINDDIIETSCANIFWFKHEKLYTPELSNSGVAGLMRAAIIDHFKETQIVKSKITEIECADAIFICNSVMGIVPVNKYNGRILEIKSILNIKAQLLSDIS